MFFDRGTVLGHREAEGTGSETESWLAQPRACPASRACPGLISRGLMAPKDRPFSSLLSTAARYSGFMNPSALDALGRCCDESHLPGTRMPT